MMIQINTRKEIPEIKVIINQIFLNSTFKTKFILEKVLKKKKMKQFSWSFQKEKTQILKTVYNKTKIKI